MTRAVVNVATDSWVKGQARLMASPFLGEGTTRVVYHNCFPAGCPPHRQRGHLGAPLAECVPYAFKAYAMKEASARHDLLLWCDACVVPIRSLEPLWERIERDGYWMGVNGYTNYEWTADSAYPVLFQEIDISCTLEQAREQNRNIPHVVATAFGLNVRHPKGKRFLDEYYRLASETKAFCGPWQNTNAPSVEGRNTGDRVSGPCGPPDVSGHRHDQTAASVIAWRLGFELTKPPEVFCYKGSETEQTILVADGQY